MPMMIARFCFFRDGEAESCIDDLKSYGFTVWSRVEPNEPNYVFVEAGRPMWRASLTRHPDDDEAGHATKVRIWEDDIALRAGCSEYCR
jgi:hypothetical protein